VDVPTDSIVIVVVFVVNVPGSDVVVELEYPVDELALLFDVLSATVCILVDGWVVFCVVEWIVLLVELLLLEPCACSGVVDATKRVPVDVSVIVVVESSVVVGGNSVVVDICSVVYVVGSSDIIGGRSVVVGGRLVAVGGSSVVVDRNSVIACGNSVIVVRSSLVVGEMSVVIAESPSVTVIV